MPGHDELNRERFDRLLAYAKRLGFGITKREVTEQVRGVPRISLELLQRPTIRTEDDRAGQFLRWAEQIADAVAEYGYEWDIDDQRAIEGRDERGSPRLSKSRFITILLNDPSE